MVVVAICIQDAMDQYLIDRVKALGLRSRAGYIIHLICEDIDRSEDKLRPQINYYGGQSISAQASIGSPTMSSFTSTKSLQVVSPVITFNAEMKAMIAKTKGNPAKLLKKISKAELQQDKARKPIERKMGDCSPNSTQPTPDLVS
jgi:hypothetical protein